MSIYTHLQWLLMVEGVEPVWTSHPRPTGMLYPYPSTVHGRGNADVNVAITGARPGSVEELDQRVAIQAGGSWSVDLAVTPTNSVAELLRVGPRSATLTAELATSLPQSVAGTSVVVAGALTAWPTSGTLHIGLEALDYTGITAPSTFTGVSRGDYDSRVVSHVVREATQGGPPKVHNAATAFKGRGARLYYADVPVGQRVSAAGQWVEMCRGYIREQPSVSQAGDVVTVTVVPWVSALGRTAGGPENVATLQTGWHCFDGRAASVFEQAIIQHWGQGDAVDETVTSISAIGAAAIANCPYAQHKGVFDPTSTDVQRQGAVYYGGTPHVVFLDPAGGAYVGAAPGTDASVCSLTVDAAKHPAGLPGATAVGMRVKNVSCAIDAESDISSGVEAILPWPTDPAGGTGALDVINDKLDVTDAYGSTLWAWHRIERDEDGGGWALTSRLNSTYAAGSMTLILTPPRSNACLWYGLSLAAPDAPTPNLTAGYAGASDSLWDVRVEAVSVGLAQEYSVRDSVAIKGCAEAFYQTGEQWMYVDSDAFDGRDEFSAVVNWVELDGTEDAQIVRILSTKDPTGIIAGAPGLLLEVEAPSYVRSFGSWRGQDEARISLAAVWRQADPRTVLLDLLMSSEGNGFVSAGAPAYDAQPYGLGLTTDDVDVDAIAAFPLVGGAVSETGDFVVLDGSPLDETVGSVCRLIGASLVTALDRETGRRRITLARSGLPSHLDAIDEITDAQWVVDRRPSDTFDSSVENVLEIASGQDLVSRETVLDVRLENITAIRGTDGRTEVYSDSAPWLRIAGGSPQDAVSALLPVAQERWALFGAPRKMITGTVAWDAVRDLNVGAVVTLSAGNIRDYDTTLGLESVTGLLVGIEATAWDATATVTLLYYGSHCSGYSPACEVASFPGASTVAVTANAYSDATSPLTGAAQSDVDFFGAGDWVRLVPLGDYASSVVRQVLSIAGHTVTLTAAHGLAIGSGVTMRPAAWTTVQSAQQDYVFVADDTATLGASDDPWQYA